MGDAGGLGSPLGDKSSVVSPDRLPDRSCLCVGPEGLGKEKAWECCTVEREKDPVPRRGQGAVRAVVSTKG